MEIPSSLLVFGTLNYATRSKIRLNKHSVRSDFLSNQDLRKSGVGIIRDGENTEVKKVRG
jgi:hypothetical protein